jgi:O-acetylhomoserine/O-acetylserine sulfhydrylase-like pyridoxal-dependent enzyme
MAKDKLRFETLALHGGNYRSDPVSGAVAVPIYQTTSYQFQDTATLRGCSRSKRSATSTPASRIRPRTRSSNGSRR